MHNMCTGRTPIVHRRSAALILPFVLALIGCTAGPAVYRDQGAPIGQTVRYAPDAMAGTWFVLAHFGDIIPNAMSFDAEAEKLRSVEGTFDVGARGLVVMWLDADGRTAVVGGADGRTGFILDRAPEVSPDRYAAALEVLDFYGWDTARISRVR